MASVGSVGAVWASASANAVRLGRAFTAPCIALEIPFATRARDRIIFLPRGCSLVVNNCVTHNSHDLASLNGLCFCLRCCGLAHRYLFMHLDECVRAVPGSYGQKNLSALKNTSLPKGVPEWPADNALFQEAR